MRQKIGSQNTHYVHNPRGITSQQVGSVWSDAISDGLGSVRGWLDSSQAFTDTNYFDPYGVPDASVVEYGFTGEMTDDNGLVYLRARYYDPNVGVFASLDPFEGVDSRPMSMNGYSWVEGNVANWVDASGMATMFADCNTIILNQIQPISCNPNPENSILNASVSIVLGMNSPLANVSISTEIAGSLGTLTNEGLITHNHFPQVPQDWKFDSPADIRTIKPYNLVDVINNLKTYDWIEFRGANGTKRVSTNEIGSNLHISSRISPNNSQAQSLLFVHPDIITIGTPISLTRGLSSSPWLFGFIRVVGENDLESYYHGIRRSCGTEYARSRYVYNPLKSVSKNHSNIQIGYVGEASSPFVGQQPGGNISGEGIGSTVDASDFFLPPYIVFRAINSDFGPGDSGAGIFIGGNLIGVYQAQALIEGWSEGHRLFTLLEK